jgi:hypothetical protein
VRLVAAVVVCFTVTCAFGGDRAPTRQVRTFRSPTYGYSIEYPAGWSVLVADHELHAGEAPLTSGGATDILARHAESRRVSEMRFPVVVIGAQLVTTGTSLDGWTDTVVEIVAAQKDCPRPKHIEMVDVDGELAALLTYPDCPAGTGYLHLWVAVVHDGRAFQIVFFDHAGHEPSNRHRLRRFLASMSFD